MDTLISKNICYLRQEKLMTQEKLGEYLGVSFKTISKWERGNSSPDLESLVKLSKLFEVPLHELITKNYDKEKYNVSNINYINGDLNYYKMDSKKEIISKIKKSSKRKAITNKQIIYFLFIMLLLMFIGYLKIIFYLLNVVF